MNLDDHPPFVLLGDEQITLTVVWHHSRWAWWKASLTYTSFDLPYGHHPGALHGSLVADGHPDPKAALDALVEAAHVMAITLDYGATPTLSLHAYSTDGTPVTYPRGTALVHAHAARLGWQPRRYPRPARRT